VPQADEEPGPPPDVPETLDAPDDRTPDEADQKAADDDHEGAD
jgi:hypothetical protein